MSEHSQPQERRFSSSEKEVRKKTRAEMMSEYKKLNIVEREMKGGRTDGLYGTSPWSTAQLPF